MDMITVEKKMELMKEAGLDTGKFLALLVKEDPQALNLSDDDLDNVTGGAFIGTAYDPKTVGDIPVCGGIQPTEPLPKGAETVVSVPQGMTGTGPFSSAKADTIFKSLLTGRW